MQLNSKIKAFSQLGQHIESLKQGDLLELCQKAQSFNPWFTEENVKLSLQGILKFLTQENLTNWTANYNLEAEKLKTVGLIMAGNIPLVGFHDYLTVLISGHKVQAKLSSQDPYLIKQLTRWLIEIEPEFTHRIAFSDRLAKFDAIIATGSNNSARYFNYYFAKYPHIIRQNRSSCAILNGKENQLDIAALGNDVFQYFGLGCRNVSKIFVPVGYDFQILLDQLNSFIEVSNHHKYANNYDYNKSIYLVNKVAHLDTGFLLLKEDKGMISPISVIFYEYYENERALETLVNASKEKIQCIASKEAWFKGSIPLGSTQQPELWDYADGVDTISFLENII